MKPVPDEFHGRKLTDKEKSILFTARLLGDPRPDWVILRRLAWEARLTGRLPPVS